MMHSWLTFFSLLLLAIRRPFKATTTIHSPSPFSLRHMKPILKALDYAFISDIVNK